MSETEYLASTGDESGRGIIMGTTGLSCKNVIAVYVYKENISTDSRPPRRVLAYAYIRPEVRVSTTNRY